LSQNPSNTEPIDSFRSLMVNMRILAFADFHGQPDAVESARRLIAAEQTSFVIVAGDVVNYDADLAKQLLLQLGRGGRPVYFVPGNMDNPALSEWSGEDQVHPIHGRCEFVDEVGLIGLGGSPRGSVKTPFQFSEEEAGQTLERLLKVCKSRERILVCHCPPVGTKVDQVSEGEHAGSLSIRKFVEAAHPILVVSGHVHEAQGVDKIGLTTTVNTGPAKNGCFARIDLTDKVTVAFDDLHRVS